MSAQPWGYSAAADWYDRLAAALWEHTAGRTALKRVRHEVGHHITHGAHVLDVGAGTGRSTQLILDEADPASVVGIDNAAMMLDKARHRVRDPRARFDVGDATALDFDDDSLDAVVALWVLETLPDPLAALRECLRVLRPDGRVIAAFSSRPDRTTAALLARPAGTVMQHLFAGRFLTEQERPLHTCSMDCIHRHAFGYVTVTTFGKRCQLSAVPAPRERSDLA
jgi:ubiquinone/menaquinone biosynthesis C-methylase UbiE